MKSWYRYEEVDCIICKSKKVERIVDKGQFGLDTHVNVCLDCGLGYLSPRWDKDAYLDFYQHEYDQYYRHNPITDHEAYERFGRAILNKLKTFLTDYPNQILDIGSGGGQLLRSFKKEYQKSELFAIEPSEDSQRSLNQTGIKLVSSSVDNNWDSAYRDAFDLIIMRHVLEHFSDPLEVLNKVKASLSLRGILFIAVPNCLEPSPNLRGKWFRVVHTYYFNKYSLKNLVAECGLEILEVVEGRPFGLNELILIAKRGNSCTQEISKSHAQEQIALYRNRLKLEQNPFYPILRRLIKIKRLIGSKL